MHWRIILLAGALLLQGCGGGQHRSGERGGRGGHGGDKAAHADSLGEMRVPVEVTTVSQGEITSRLEYHTTMTTEDAVEVFPLVAGNVSQLQVEEGDRVSRGDVLLQLSEDQRRIDLEQAELEYGHLTDEFARATELYDKDLMSEEEFAGKRYALERARLQLATARLNLERCVITAPLEGIIASRTTGPGEYVTPSSQLFSIINTTEPIAELNLSQMYYPVIRQGLEAQIYSDLFPQQLFPGEIKRINPVVDAASGTFKVTVAIDNSTDLLRPGMFVNVHLILDVHPDAVLIPKNALLYENEKTCAFVLQGDSMAFKRELLLDYSSSQEVEVRSGVTAGETIVVVGQSALQDSTLVRIIHYHPGGNL